MTKQSHSAVNYDHGTQERHCGVCTMYRRDKNLVPHCTAVVDPIFPMGVCKIFQKKEPPDDDNSVYKRGPRVR